jgi:hypothetical protein
MQHCAESYNSVLTHQALCATMRREVLFEQLSNGGRFTFTPQRQTTSILSGAGMGTYLRGLRPPWAGGRASNWFHQRCVIG